MDLGDDQSVSLLNRNAFLNHNSLSPESTGSLPDSLRVSERGCRGTSLTRKRPPLGPYRRHMSGVAGGSQGVERFLMSEVTLCVRGLGRKWSNKARWEGNDGGRASFDPNKRICSLSILRRRWERDLWEEDLTLPRKHRTPLSGPRLARERLSLLPTWFPIRGLLSQDTPRSLFPVQGYLAHKKQPPPLGPP